MRARRRALFVFVLGAAGATGATGCGGKGGGGTVDATPTYGSIDVEPAHAQLTVLLGTTVQQTYQVFGVDGSAKTDITSACVMSLDAQFGQFTGATLTAVPHGGKTTVTATCGM